jgi:hypothetical protein
VLLNVSLCEIVLSVIQIPVNFHKRDQFRRQSSELDHVDIVDLPLVGRENFHLHRVVVHVAVDFSISQRLQLHARNDVLKNELL